MQTQTLIAYTLVAAVSVVTPGPASILAMRNGASGASAGHEKRGAAMN